MTLEELRALEPGWSSYGADTPSEESLQCAEDWIEWAKTVGLRVDRIAPDANGGVAVYLVGTAPNREAWMSKENEDQHGIAVLRDGHQHVEYLDTEYEWKERTLSFLNGG